MILPKENLEYSDAEARVNLVFNNVTWTTRRGEVCSPYLKVDVVDSYGYARQLVVESTPGGSYITAHITNLCFCTYEVRGNIVVDIIAKILDCVKNYPNIYFNKSRLGSPRCHGFVRLHDNILWKKQARQ